MAHILLCLRGNLSLAGDSTLSDHELAALLPGVVLRRQAAGPAWAAFVSRGDGEATAPPPPAVDACYRAEIDADAMIRLLDRATFLQQVFALPAPAEAPAFARLAGQRPGLRRWSSPLFSALTVQCATEVASLVGAKAAIGQAEPAFDSAVAALLGDPCTERELAQAVTLARRPRASAYLAHDLHVYKAKFFPRMARAVVNIAAGPPSGAGAGLVLDPFAGSGTTLLEASRLGLPSLGTDIDPLAVRIAGAKLLLPHADAGALGRWLEDGTFARPVAGETAPAVRLAFPDWLGRKLTPAQTEDVLDDANGLAAAVAALPAGPERVLAWICLSDALTRKLHMRFLGTGAGRFALEVRRLPVRALFLRRYAALCREAVLYRDLLPRHGLIGTAGAAPAAALAADARCLPLPDGAVAAVVTSPPYLPASSGRENYLMSKAPSLLLLGLLDAAGVRALNQAATGSMGLASPGDPEGGASPAARLSGEEQRLVGWLAGDALRSIKAEPVRRYFLDLRAALAELRRVLRPGGRAAVVVGTRSTFYRFATREAVYTVETAAMLAEAAVSLGLAVDQLIEVELDKGNRNARPRSLDSYSETIVMVKN